MADKAILFDATKCTGCRGCQVACKGWNDLEAEETTNRGTIENPPELSPKTWLKMTFIEHEDNNAPGELAWLFTRRACMHCTKASCVDICPTHALHHHVLGFVAYDKDKCSGCGYCINNCPFKVPQAPTGGLTTERHIDKCLFCADRVANDALAEEKASNAMPACVKSCNPGALRFGDRDELIALAEARVVELQGKDNGDRFPDANLYGKDELGGLHVMYVLPYKPEVHGLPANPKVPVTTSLLQDILPPIGLAVVGAAVAGMGFNYFVARVRANRNKEEKVHG
jgi:formate dehydrogenase iron-sulfur subunit